MQSFLTHIMNEKVGSNGTIGLYKKDGQGGYTASDDETNHDCKEEHPGVSHKKWVASKEVDEDAMSDAARVDRERQTSNRPTKPSGGIASKIKNVVGKLSQVDRQVAAVKKQRANGPAKPVGRLSHADRQLAAAKRGEEIDLFTGMPLDELTDSQRNAREKSRTRTHGGEGMTKTKDDFGKTTTHRGQMSVSAFAKRVARDKNQRRAKTDEAYTSSRSRRRAFAQTQGSSHDIKKTVVIQ
jgi:hypothetical protein